MDMALDFGNALVKGIKRDTVQYFAFRHAFHVLTGAQWSAVYNREHRIPEGFLIVNGQPVVYGDPARRYLIRERPEGSARYTREYYGLGVCAVLAEGLGPLKKHVRGITLMCTHPPKDLEYAPEIRASALGEWNVESTYGSFRYTVSDVFTMDEPLAGYSHHAFTYKGTENANNQLRNATTLVVDVGGFTTDVAAIDPGGHIDLLSLQSSVTGVNHVLADFEKAMRREHRNRFQRANELDIRRVEGALMTGEYPFGNLKLDVRQPAYESRMVLVNDVVQIIEQAGGAANFDVFLLTGGGSAFVYEDLKERFPEA